MIGNRERVIDVLLYLFENFVENEHSSDASADLLRNDLESAGFPPADVDLAFEWLHELEDRKQNPVGRPNPGSVRVYAHEEVLRISPETQNFLIGLENTGILVPEHRETVLDRLMALDSDQIDIEQAKWVTLMVLFNQPGQEEAYARMEDIVYERGNEPLH